MSESAPHRHLQQRLVGVVDGGLLARMTGGAAKVWIALLRRADYSTGVAWPSISTIATDAGIGRATVCRALGELARLQVVQRTPGGGAVTTQYRLLPVSPTRRGKGATSLTGETGVVSPVRRNQSHPRDPNVVKERNQQNVAKAARPSLDERSPILSTDSFERAWEDFERHRRELKKPLTATARARLLAKLATWGVDRAVAALETSVANGWRGVFEPNGHTGRTSPHRETLVDGEELAHVREL